MESNLSGSIMNSNRKIKSERTRTPVHLNTTEYGFNSVTKKFSPNLSRRPNLNETVVGLRCGPPSDPKFKNKLATNYEVNYETEFDLAYNDYLQAQMKKQFAKKKVKEHGQVLKDQLLIQNENLRKRQQILKEIVANTKSFQTKSEIVQIIEYLQEHFINFIHVCTENNIKVGLSHCKDILNLECDKIVLKNIKNMETQEEYEKFSSVLKLSLAASQKIINSGRNFKEVYDLAENIRNLSILLNAVEKSQQTVAELERNALYNFLQNMSDFFAKKYSEHSC